MAEESEKDFVRDMAHKEFATHVMRGEETISRTFRRADGGSQYWFRITWTPGHLTLTGDVGDLTLCHYYALRSYEDGLAWALEADHDYLMSKTGVSQQYDPEATARFIVQHANEEPILALNGDRRRAGFPRTGFRHDLQAWRRMRLDEREDISDDDPRVIRLWPDWKRRWDLYLDLTPLDDLYEIPDCWNVWTRIWRALRGEFHRPGLSTEGPEFVIKAANRAKLKSQIKSLCESRDEAVGFCLRIGLDDYYGSEKWNAQTYWQIEAIKHGCGMMLEEADSCKARVASFQDNESQAPNGAVARELLEAG